MHTAVHVPRSSPPLPSPVTSAFPSSNTLTYTQPLPRQTYQPHSHHTSKTSSSSSYSQSASSSFTALSLFIAKRRNEENARRAEEARRALETDDRDTWKREDIDDDETDSQNAQHSTESERSAPQQRSAQHYAENDQRPHEYVDDNERDDDEHNNDTPDDDKYGDALNRPNYGRSHSFDSSQLPSLSVTSPYTHTSLYHSPSNGSNVAASSGSSYAQPQQQYKNNQQKPFGFFSSLLYKSQRTPIVTNHYSVNNAHNHYYNNTNSQYVASITSQHHYNNNFHFNNHPTPGLFAATTATAPSLTSSPASATSSSQHSHIHSPSSATTAASHTTSMSNSTGALGGSGGGSKKGLLSYLSFTTSTETHSPSAYGVLADEGYGAGDNDDDGVETWRLDDEQLEEEKDANDHAAQQDDDDTQDITDTLDGDVHTVDDENSPTEARVVDSTHTSTDHNSYPLVVITPAVANAILQPLPTATPAAVSAGPSLTALDTAAERFAEEVRHTIELRRQQEEEQMRREAERERQRIRDREEKAKERRQRVAEAAAAASQRRTAYENNNITDSNANTITPVVTHQHVQHERSHSQSYRSHAHQRSNYGAASSSSSLSTHQHHRMQSHLAALAAAAAEKADNEEYETFTLRIITRAHQTGIHASHDFTPEINSVIAGRYLVVRNLGTAAFSTALECIDIRSSIQPLPHVCIKVVKNKKEFFDASLDEIRILSVLNQDDSEKLIPIIRLYDYFYSYEHLFLVFELLQMTLFEQCRMNMHYLFSLQQQQHGGGAGGTAVTGLHANHMISRYSTNQPIVSTLTQPSLTNDDDSDAEDLVDGTESPSSRRQPSHSPSFLSFNSVLRPASTGPSIRSFSPSLSRQSFSPSISARRHSLLQSLQSPPVLTLNHSAASHSSPSQQHHSLYHPQQIHTLPSFPPLTSPLLGNVLPHHSSHQQAAQLSSPPLLQSLVSPTPTITLPKHYFSLSTLRTIAEQLLIALEFTHSHAIMHCDIKPENIMLSSIEPCRIKLIDFGSSAYINDQPTFYVQSRPYRAPEVIMGYDYGYDGRIDIWSLACVLFELHTGCVLFSNGDIRSVLEHHVGILGAFDVSLLERSQYTLKYFDKVSNIEYDGYEGNSYASPPSYHYVLRKHDESTPMDETAENLTVRNSPSQTRASPLSHPHRPPSPPVAPPAPPSTPQLIAHNLHLLLVTHSPTLKLILTDPLANTLPTITALSAPTSQPTVSATFPSSPAQSILDEERRLYPLFVDFLCQSLSVNPNQRITATNALKHRFITAPPAVTTAANASSSVQQRMS